MHRQFGSPASAWQAAQSNSTFERATPSSERDAYTFPETIALNSESDQSLRQVVEVKSNQFLGPVSLTNDRPSRLLQAAHLSIADQSPFNLRNTDPRISIKDLNLPSQAVGAPPVVAEVNLSPVSVPLPPRNAFDATKNPLPLPESAPAPKLATGNFEPYTTGNFESYNTGAESYRGVSAYSPNGSYHKSAVQATQPISDSLPQPTAESLTVRLSVPAPPTFPSPESVAFKASSDVGAVDSGHIHAAWGLSEEPTALRGGLNKFLPGVGSAPKKASVSFEGGMLAAKATPTDENVSKAIKAGDALHTGRMGTGAAKLREANRMQTCSSLPLFDTSSMRNKFQAANVTFSKSISPTGERTQVQTAPDFSSITEVWTPANDGSYVYKSVYRDELNRVRYEESVCAQGLRTIVQTGYCDKEDKKSPFVAYKMMIKPDGTRELLT